MNTRKGSEVMKLTEEQRIARAAKRRKTQEEKLMTEWCEAIKRCIEKIEPKRPLAKKSRRAIISDYYHIRGKSDL